MTDHSLMKLGKHPAPKSYAPHVRHLRSYLLDAPLPRPAAVTEYTTVASWPMLLNDTIGDCTIAAVGHACQLWGLLTWKDPRVVTDADVLAAYEANSGYVPGDPSTDNGATCVGVLEYWRTKGVGPHKIAHWLASDNALIPLTVYLFGAAYIGLLLPMSAQSQDVWDVTTGPDAEAGSWGGHCVPVVGYDAEALYIVTWGAIKKMTYAFLDAYSDESYAPLSGEWVNSESKAPNALDWAQLKADLVTDFLPPVEIGA